MIGWFVLLQQNFLNITDSFPRCFTLSKKDRDLVLMGCKIAVKHFPCVCKIVYISYCTYMHIVVYVICKGYVVSL